MSRFSISSFRTFMAENNIIATAVATVLSASIQEVSEGFINCIVMPMIDRDIDNDGIEDIKTYKDITIRWNGMTFALGKFIYTVIKFFLILIIMYLMATVIKSFK